MPQMSRTDWERMVETHAEIKPTPVVDIPKIYPWDIRTRELDEFAWLSCKQYLAGMIVQPTTVKLASHSCEVQPFGSDGQATVLYRYVFRANVPKLGPENWLLTITAAGSRGKVDPSDLGPVQFYMWDASTHTWKHAFDYEHRKVAHDRDVDSGAFHLDDGQSFPTPTY